MCDFPRSAMSPPVELIVTVPSKVMPPEAVSVFAYPVEERTPVGPPPNVISPSLVIKVVVPLKYIFPLPFASKSAEARTGLPEPVTVNTRVAVVVSATARFASSEIPPGAVMFARGVRSL